MFVAYSTGVAGTSGNMIIGPDGNIWVLTATQIIRFDLTTHVSTAFTIAGASQLTGLCSDGTYLYASDEQATTSPFTLIYRINTTGASSAFFTTGVANQGGDLYFDGTDIWATSFNGFYQIDTSGGVVNTYAKPNNFTGGLINDGTYWWSAANQEPNTGVSRAAIGAPGVWTDFSTGFNSGDPTFLNVEAGGLVWVGNDEGNRLFSVTPSTGAVNSYGTLGVGDITRSCFDGTDLWFCSNAGIWQTTPAAPSTGTAYTASGPITLNTTAILYDPSTNTIWASGVYSGTDVGIFGNSLVTMQIAGII